MPSYKYSFVKCRYANGIVDERGQTFVPVRITNPSTGVWRMAWGLIDTGAESCLFPANLAAKLGHVLKAKGVKASVASGIEERPVTT